MSFTPAVKRACDACHRRKVRCNSQQPCGNCSQAHLSCTYDAVPQKKGPKGNRARVISELRETQRQPDTKINLSLQDGPRTCTSPPDSPSDSPAPERVPLELIDSCVAIYFSQMYPVMPILYEDQVQQSIGEMGSSSETYCLITSLCAFILIQPGIIGSGSLTVDKPVSLIIKPRAGNALIEEVRRIRKGMNYMESPSVTSVITSFFLFGCTFALSKHNAAWNHLREATGQLYSLGMQHEESYQSGHLRESSRKKRLFWLLFVTERAYALQKHVPLTLHATISLPNMEDDDPTGSMAGFIHLVKLYRPFDDDFIGLWNKSRRDCSTAWLAQLQQQLTKALPSKLDTPESQAADLRTSQQWLRTVVWQLSIANQSLSSNSPEPSMTFGYPIEIARDLVSVCRGFSKQSMEIHGIGLIEKVFDVACTLIDVMSCVPLDSPRPQVYLNELLILIANLRGGETRYLPLVMAKIQDTLPSIGSALPQNLVKRAAQQMQSQSTPQQPQSQHNIGSLASITPSSRSSPASSATAASTGAASSSATTAAAFRPVSAVSSGYGIPNGVRIKQEYDTVADGYNGAHSGTSSPYEAPSFLHYYPLA